MKGIVFTFNGLNLSPALSTYRVAYEASYRKTVTSLDGTEYFGNGTRRPIVTFSLLPMTGVQAKTYYDALKVMVSNCAYTDPATNAVRTARMRVTSNLEYLFCHKAVDDNLYYKGGALELRGVETIA